MLKREIFEFATTYFTIKRKRKSTDYINQQVFSSIKQSTCIVLVSSLFIFLFNFNFALTLVVKAAQQNKKTVSSIHNIQN